MPKLIQCWNSITPNRVKSRFIFLKKSYYGKITIEAGLNVCQNNERNPSEETVDKY